MIKTYKNTDISHNHDNNNSCSDSDNGNENVDCNWVLNGHGNNHKSNTTSEYDTT